LPNSIEQSNPLAERDVKAYLIASGATAAAGLLEFLLQSWLGNGGFFLPYVLAVGGAAFYGGLRPGLFATALGAFLSVFLFATPMYSVRLETFPEVAGVSLFIVVGVLISVLCDRLRAAGSQIVRHRKQMEFVLSETGVGTWMNRLPLGELKWDKETRILFWLRPDEKPTGELFWSRLHPDDREPTRLAMEAAIGDHARYEIEHRAIHPDTGEVRWIKSVGKATYGPDGTPIRFDGINYDITDRKLAEQAAEATARDMATMLESVTDGFVRYDREWRFLYLNAEAERINQRSRGELLGKNLWEMFPAVVGTPLETEFRRAVAEQTTVEFENYYEPFNRWYALKGYPTPDGGLTTFIRDITIQKRALDQLRQSEESQQRQASELHAVLAAVPACVWIANDPDCTNITGNPESYELLRIPSASNQSMSAAGIERPSHFKVLKDGVELEPHQLPVQLAAKGVEVRDFEEEIVFDDGTRLYLLGHATPLRDEAGQVRGSVAAFVDITERRRVELQIRQSEQLIHDVVERCPFGIYIVDSSFRIARMNKDSQVGAFRNIQPVIGYDFAAAVHIIWPDDVAEFVIDRFRHTLDTGEPYSSHGFKHPRRGSDVVESYEWNLHRTTLPDGQHAVICYYFDSTELRKAEAALVESDKRKDEFLATLAHELRNPLAPIKTAIQLMAMTGVDGETEALRRIMARQADHLVRLIDDLLDVSRISRGKVVLRKEVVDIASVVSAAVEASSTFISENGQKLHVDCASESIYIDADPARITQVISNLLNNASKYSGSGCDIFLTVTQSDQMAVIAVRDNGVGITADQLENIFQMFSQVNDSLERGSSGLGIGLSLVRSFVEMHGGTVTAQSEGLGCGSLFTATLPIANKPNRFDVATVPPSTRLAAATHRRFKVLIVEDQRELRMVMRRLLETMGHEVVTADNGEDAIEALNSFKPDIIFSDISMPGMTGYDLIRELRKRSDLLGVRMIAMTGFGQETDRKAALESGFDEHLVKPVDVDRLNELFSRLSFQDRALEQSLSAPHRLSR
jgi:signal transduction histidine kinase/ActR/RegA family two-component response regulator